MKKKQESYSSVLFFFKLFSFCFLNVFFFVFFLALDVMRDLSSLSPMQTRDTVAAASPKTALAQETELKV